MSIVIASVLLFNALALFAVLAMARFSVALVDEHGHVVERTSGWQERLVARARQAARGVEQEALV